MGSKLILLLLVTTTIMVASLKNPAVRMAKYSEIRAAITPPSHTDMIMGTQFVFSFINSNLNHNDTSYSSNLYLTVTNPGSVVANVQISSIFPSFQNRSTTVNPNSSKLVPITPEEVQTGFDHPDANHLFYDNKAIWVNSDQAIKLVATNQLSDGSSEDKFSVIPVCQLGKKYYSVNDESSRKVGPTSANVITIIGTQDNTTVNFDFSINPFVLNRGQQVTLNLNYYASSALISADKPVAVISGAVCGLGYYNQIHCSHESLMLYPVENWDKNYPYYKFLPEDQGEIMLFFEYDNTTVYLDNDYLDTLNSAVFYIVRVPYGVFVNGDKPFYAVAVGSVNVNDQGAPFFAHIPGPTHFTTGPIVFGTAYTSDEANNMRNLARVITYIDNIGDINVDGFYPSGFMYQRMGMSKYYYVDVDIKAGQHVVAGRSSTSEFSVVVYGYGQYRSYAFNPGLNLNTAGTC